MVLNMDAGEIERHLAGRKFKYCLQFYKPRNATTDTPKVTAYNTATISIILMENLLFDVLHHRNYCYLNYHDITVYVIYVIIGIW